MLLIMLLLVPEAPLWADSGTVEVHEWGVVVFDESGGHVRAAPEDQVTTDGFIGDWDDIEVEAPVIWFHGSEFTGKLSILLPEGSFTTLYPDPANGSDQIPLLGESAEFAVWEDVSAEDLRSEIVTEETEEESVIIQLEMISAFDYALPYWRAVPSLDLTIGDWHDNFIYYEMSLPTADSERHARPLQVHEYFQYAGPALLLRADEGQLKAWASVIDDDVTVQDSVGLDNITDIINGWTGNEFLAAEIDALWETWLPEIRTRCIHHSGTVLIFPLPEDDVSSISRMELDTDQQYDVIYRRLFLGLSDYYQD